MPQGEFVFLGEVHGHSWTGSFRSLFPQDPFSEEMEVESLTTQEGNVVPGSPSDQTLRDLDTDQWPSQAPEDQLLGAS